MAAKEKRFVIDGTFWLLLGVLAVLMLAAHGSGGGERVRTGLSDGVRMLVRFAPMIAVSLLVAGFVDSLIPREWVRAHMGADSGMRGILLSAGAGAITPAGPFVSMPIAAVMIRSGAGPGPVVAFLSGWALLAIHRLVAWEVPMLGWRFAAFRYAVCLVLPVGAGWLARLVAR